MLQIKFQGKKRFEQFNLIANEFSRDKNERNVPSCRHTQNNSITKPFNGTKVSTAQ